MSSMVVLRDGAIKRAKERLSRTHATSPAEGQKSHEKSCAIAFKKHALCVCMLLVFYATQQTRTTGTLASSRDNSSDYSKCALASLHGAYRSDCVPFVTCSRGLWIFPNTHFPDLDYGLSGDGLCAIWAYISLSSSSSFLAMRTMVIRY